MYKEGGEASKHLQEANDAQASLQRTRWMTGTESSTVGSRGSKEGQEIRGSRPSLVRIEREFAIRERLLKRVQLRIERLMDDPMTTSRLGKDIAKKYNRKLNDTLSQHRKTKIILELKKIFPSVKKGMGEELNKEGGFSGAFLRIISESSQLVGLFPGLHSKINPDGMLAGRILRECARALDLPPKNKSIKSILQALGANGSDIFFWDEVLKVRIKGRINSADYSSVPIQPQGEKIKRYGD